MHTANILLPVHSTHDFAALSYVALRLTPAYLDTLIARVEQFEALKKADEALLCLEYYDTPLAVVKVADPDAYLDVLEVETLSDALAIFEGDRPEVNFVSQLASVKVGSSGFLDFSFLHKETYGEVEYLAEAVTLEQLRDLFDATLGVGA